MSRKAARSEIKRGVMGMEMPESNYILRSSPFWFVDFQWPQGGNSQSVLTLPPMGYRILWLQWGGLRGNP